MGSATFGALFGPVVGAAAALAGRAAVFTALAGLAVVLAALTLRIAGVPEEPLPSLASIVAAVRHRRFFAGLALMALPSLLFGVLATLAPLHLSRAGWGAAAIGSIWLLGAALESVQAPLTGRFSDRRGLQLPVRIALVVGVGVSVGLAFGARPAIYAPLVVVAAMAYGTLFTPAFILLADGAERVGLAQGMAFGLMNAAWALGAVVGPAAGGAIASAAGDSVSYHLAAAACALALVSQHERAAVLVDRLARHSARVG
jgi:MFS family permease